MKSFGTETLIQAPRERIWALLTDAPGYPGWNPTVERVEGAIVSGALIKVRRKADPGRAFPVKVTTFVPGERMVWTGGMPLGLFTGTREFVLTPQGGGVRFAMREVYTGPLAGLIGRSIPDLQPDFETFAASLKARAEAADG